MYWWIKKNIQHRSIAAGMILSAVSFLACSTDTNQVAQKQEKQFDIPAFFQQETQRLGQQNREITKTVSKETASETKKISIKDWEKELSAFSSVDLNKAAYSGQIHKDSADRLVKLSLSDPHADISSVQIQYADDNTPDEIHIIKNIDNLLYQTTEKLSYRKNKGYKIEKQQHVWLLGSNSYTIEGTF